MLSGARVKQVSVSVRSHEDLSSEDQSWRIRHQRWISASPGTRRGQDQSYSGEDRYWPMRALYSSHMTNINQSHCRIQSWRDHGSEEVRRTSARLGRSLTRNRMRGNAQIILKASDHQTLNNILFLWRCSVARFPRISTRTSWFLTSRSAARSGIFVWWWIQWLDWTGEWHWSKTTCSLHYLSPGATHSSPSQHETRRWRLWDR